MYTREAFDKQRAAVNQVERREGRWLAGVSVGLGVAQLIFNKWAETRLESGIARTIAGVTFLAYLAVVIALLVRYERRRNAARPKCPHCRARLKGMSERVAAATGRCDACGGQVLA